MKKILNNLISIFHFSLRTVLIILIFSFFSNFSLLMLELTFNISELLMGILNLIKEYSFLLVNHIQFYIEDPNFLYENMENFIELYIAIISNFL